MLLTVWATVPVVVYFLCFLELGLFHFIFTYMLLDLKSLYCYDQGDLSI